MLLNAVYIYIYDIAILRKYFFIVKIADTKQFDIQEFGASSDS